MNPYAKVSVFLGREMYTAEQLLFHTNGGAEAIQNNNLGVFCPKCGDVWARVLVPGHEQWRVEYSPCLRHVSEHVHYAFDSRDFWPLAFLHNPDHGLLLVEFKWYIERAKREPQLFERTYYVV